MNMWFHLRPENLVCWQRKAALMHLDLEIRRAHADGYDMEVDRLLDERQRIMDLLDAGPVA